MISRDEAKKMLAAIEAGEIYTGPVIEDWEVNGCP